MSNIDKDPVEMINLIKDISPVVNECLNTKSYLSEIKDDEVTDEFLLLISYMILIEELNNIGIFFDENSDNVLEDFYYAEGIYHLRKVIDPKTVYDTINANKSKLTDITFFINDESNYESLIKEYIDFFLKINQENEDLNRCLNIYDRIYNTEEFKYYLKNILELINESYDTVDNDIKEYLTVNAVVQKDRRDFKLALHKIEQSGINADWGLLDSIADKYDLQKINSPDRKMFVFAFYRENVVNELDDSIKQLVQEYIDIHHNTNSHHIEYWLNTHEDKPITSDYVIVLVSHFYHPIESDKINEETQKQINNINNMVEKSKGRVDKELVQKLIEILYKV